MINSYLKNFSICEGVNGELLKLITKEDLEHHKINMTITLHQKKFLMELDDLKKRLPSSFDIWNYKVINTHTSFSSRKLSEP